MEYTPKEFISNIDYVFGIIKEFENSNEPVTITKFIDIYNLLKEVHHMSMFANDNLFENESINDINKFNKFKESSFTTLINLESTLKEFLEHKLIDPNLSTFDKFMINNTLANINAGNDIEDETTFNYIKIYKTLIESNPQDIIDGYANKNNLYYQDTQFINDVIITTKDKYLSLKNNDSNNDLKITDLLNIEGLENKYKEQLGSNITLLKDGVSDSKVFIDVYYKNIDDTFFNANLDM